jgi:hypothetical protein
MLSVVRDFHNVMAKYTDFVIKDIAQKYQLDYAQLSDRYIARCNRAAARSRQQHPVAAPTTAVECNNGHGGATECAGANERTRSA